MNAKYAIKTRVRSSKQPSVQSFSFMALQKRFKELKEMRTRFFFLARGRARAIRDYRHFLFNKVASVSAFKKEVKKRGTCFKLIR